jgi:pimeloyl-ACP methyl ester carboxylesterase
MTATGTVESKGCTLSFTVVGEGPPVLFIQGVGVHGGGWTPQVDDLAKHHQCVYFDNRGMGLSQPPGCRIRVEQMADDAAVIMDTLGWTSAHVVGHSLGGLVALHLALSARPRVRSLSLLCTFARGRDATPLSWWVLSTGLRTKIGTRRQRRLAFLELVMPSGVLRTADRDELAARLVPIFGHDLGEAPAITMKQLSAMRAYDATPRLRELGGLPAMVLSAAHDRIAPPSLGRALAAGIESAQYVELAQASHGATIQCAPEVNSLLADHLARAENRVGTVTSQLSQSTDR